MYEDGSKTDIFYDRGEKGFQFLIKLSRLHL